MPPASPIHDRTFGLLLILPVVIVLVAFFIIPIARLALVGASGPNGFWEYGQIISNPRYLRTTVATCFLAVLVTAFTLVIGTICGIFLVRHNFAGRRLLLAALTFPLAFPGVVVGFMIILLAGRQGLINSLAQAATGSRLVFAYSMMGLFVGYLYFSIPRVLLTVMGGIEKLDPALPEAARSLGATPFQILRDITLPALSPALIASGAIAFATAMGAFGTAFTLATNIDVLPMLIYSEFTLRANFATAGALSIMLGLITWAVLALARSLSGTTVAASG